jgi:hypothetical protein
MTLVVHFPYTPLHFHGLALLLFWLYALIGVFLRVNCTRTHLYQDTFALLCALTISPSSVSSGC